jgi:hypothetical protein
MTRPSVRPAALLFALVLVGLPETLAQAHGGGLNACGCHFNRKTGECHCHQNWGCGCECQDSSCNAKREPKPHKPVKGK